MKRSILKTLLTIGLALFAAGTSSSLYAQSGAKKVLILDFVNGGGGAKIDFFHTTASDIFNEKLLEANKFEIISKAKTQKAINKLRLSNGQIHLKKNAIRIAELVDADIIITGEYKIESKNYTFSVHVYHMSLAEEKKDFKDQIKGSLSKSVFAGMDNLAEQVARRLSRTTSSKIPGKTEKRRSSGYTRFNPVMNLSFLGFYIPGFSKTGAGLKLNWQPPPLGKFIHTYYEFEATQILNAGGHLTTWYYSISYLGLLWPFQIGQHFVLAPYVLAGEYFMTEGPVPNSDGPVLKAGASARLYFGKALGVVLDGSMALPMFSSRGNGGPSGFIPIINLSLGITYRIK